MKPNKETQKNLNIVKNNKTKYLNHGSFKLKAPPLAVVLSIRHLSLMLRSGLAIADALKVISTQAAHPNLKKIYAEMLVQVQAGSSLAENMKNYKNTFSDVVISIVNAGEQGGSLEKNLIFLADYLKKDYELKRKIKGALFYPMIVFVITIAEMLGVMFFIIPQLETLFNSFKNVGALTSFIINFTKFFRGNIIQLAVGGVSLFFGLKFFLKTKTGKSFKDRLALNFPIFNTLNKNTILTTFSRTLGILLESGIPIAKALQISSETIGNGIYQKILSKVAIQIKEGQNLADTLVKYPKYFPGNFVKLIEVGEQTGTLEENLLFLYEFYSEDVEEMSSNFTTLIEPLLLVFVGLMIGLLAISIVGPIYQLTSSIND